MEDKVPVCQSAMSEGGGFTVAHTHLLQRAAFGAM